MRLLILSDLHVESTPFMAPRAGVDADFDVVVLAGDIHNGQQALTWARSSFPGHRIVQVAGNHEFYDGRYDACLQRLREAARGLDIDFLENDRVLIDGVEFLGCTLWTDYQVFDRDDRPLRMSADDAMRANLRLMADYFAIEVDDPHEGPRLFSPADSVALHQRSIAWLDAALAEPAAGPRVVVSHHLPSWTSVVPKYINAVSNAAFVSDLDDRVAKVDLWIHGHTHSSQRYRIADCEVISNPRGYPSRKRGAGPDAFENPTFDPRLVLPLG